MPVFVDAKEIWKKSFDIATDINKQMITLSTINISLLAAISGWGLNRGQSPSYASLVIMFVGAIFALISIIPGIYCLMAMAGNLSKIRLLTETDFWNKDFAHITYKRYAIIATIQVILFLLSLLCTFIAIPMHIFD